MKDFKDPSVLKELSRVVCEEVVKVYGEPGEWGTSHEKILSLLGFFSCFVATMLCVGVAPNNRDDAIIRFDMLVLEGIKEFENRVKNKHGDANG